MKKIDADDIEMLEEEENEETYSMKMPKFDEIEFSNSSLDEEVFLNHFDADTVKEETKTVKKDQKDTVASILSTEPVDKNSNGLKPIFILFIFVILFLFVFFLPNISDLLRHIGNSNKSFNRIVNGTLVCSVSKDDDEFSYEYKSDFTFRDSKLNKLFYSYTVIGDKDVDSDKLESFHNKCSRLHQVVRDMDGVLVSCKFANGKFVQTQTIDYLSIDEQKVSAAYFEAGGVYPSFSKGQNIDTIEKNMKSSGYVCTRNR